MELFIQAHPLAAIALAVLGTFGASTLAVGVCLVGIRAMRPGVR